MSKYRFIGKDRSKGYKNGSIYELKLTVSNDPNDFFIHINPHTDFLGIKSWKLDDTFYNSWDAFRGNWVDVT